MSAVKVDSFQTAKANNDSNTLWTRGKTPGF